MEAAGALKLGADWQPEKLEPKVQPPRLHTGDKSFECEQVEADRVVNRSISSFQSATATAPARAVLSATQYTATSPVELKQLQNGVFAIGLLPHLNKHCSLDTLERAIRRSESKLAMNVVINNMQTANTDKKSFFASFINTMFDKLGSKYGYTPRQVLENVHQILNSYDVGIPLDTRERLMTQAKEVMLPQHSGEAIDKATAERYLGITSEIIALFERKDSLNKEKLDLFELVAKSKGFIDMETLKSLDEQKASFEIKRDTILRKWFQHHSDYGLPVESAISELIDAMRIIDSTSMSRALTDYQLSE